MPRRVQDIIPNDRRSVRDIPVSKDISSASPRLSSEIKAPKSKEEVIVKIHKVVEKDEPKAKVHQTTAILPHPKRKVVRKKSMWAVLTLGIIVLVGVVTFIASTYLSRAIFVITPKVRSVIVNTPLVIKRDVVNDLAYDVITMKSSESMDIPAVNGPIVSVRAEGVVTVYNAYSPSSVRLIVGTRIANDTGKVYRLKSSINIPGYTKPSGSILAGSVSANVVADQPGPDFNISRSDSMSDFKMVAYKGTEKYDSIYARLKSDVSGGASGTKKIVNPATLSATVTTLKSKILASLLTQVKGAVPTGYIMYDSAYTSSYSAAEVGGKDPSKATVTVRGVVYGIILEKSKLTSKLSAPGAVSTFGNLGFTTVGLEDLSFVITNLKDFSPDKKSSLVLNVKGNLKLIGTVPIEDVKKALAGKSLAESKDVLKSFSPVIETANGELVPPWAKIPGDVSRITINVKPE